VFVQLKPWGVRKLTADEVINQLRPKLARVPGITLFLQNVQDVRLGGRGSRTQYQYTIVDANLAELNEWAPRVLARLRSLPELRDVNTDQQTQGLKLNVEVDRDSAARLGITPQLVDDTLYDAFRPAAGGDDLHAAQPVSGGPGGEAGVPGQPGGLAEALPAR